MNRLKTVVFNITLSLNSLLLLFAIFGERLSVPAWIQVIGRMHPLLVHFPIVMLLGWIVWRGWTPRPLAPGNAAAARWFLLATAALTALTALAGVLLSNETGYSPEAIGWHKYGGILLSFFLLAWYYWLDRIDSRKTWLRIVSATAFLLVLITGHEGSSITHGDNYLLAPVTSTHKSSDIPIEDALVFRDMVMPILESKCLGCHSFSKAKGGLILENHNTIAKGGKSGPLYIKDQPDMSLLLQRIHLAATEKKHMPPAGKPQPDDDEMAILYQWIKTGADFTRKVADLPSTDTLRMLADNIFSKPPETETSYDFSAAAEKDIEALNNNNRQVHPLAQGSPALTAAFYNRGLYTTASLQELQKLGKQIVALDLSYMPVKEQDIALLTAFKNCRRLNLNFTTLPGKSLAILEKLPQLEELSIAGTGLKSQDLQTLAKCKKLHAVYAWELPVTQTELAAITRINPAIRFETGVNGDSLRVKLNPPLLLTDARVVNGRPLALKLKHFVPNSVIRYTLDGTPPDSVNSPVYKDSILLDQAATLRVRAFKQGWLGSDSLIARFYKNTWLSDSIRSLTPLDSFYKGRLGAKTLIDGEKDDDNFGDGKWLGFRRNRMEMLLHYPNPVTIRSVSVSSLTDSRAMIMPPQMIELYGGPSPNNMTRLGRIIPIQPDTLHPSTMPTYDFICNPTTVRYIRIVATPVAKLPPWHPAKGQQAWFFTDEIFVN